MNKLEPIVKTADLICICSNNSISPEVDSNFNLVALSGLVYPLNSQPTLYSFSNRDLSNLKEKLEDLKGEWIAILANNNQTVFKIISDHFGFQSVFYRFDEITETTSQLVVSTNYNSLIEYSKNNSLPYTLNNEQFYLAMGSRSMRLRTAFSSETFCREIKLLKADESLYFDSTINIFEVRKEAFLFDPLKRSYEELLVSGINRAKQDIKSISQYYNDKRLFLSGGRDSRMVLALISSAEVNKEYSVSMANPHNFSGLSKDVVEKDLYVSNYLAHEYKMKLSRLSDYVRINLDFEESLQKVLSHWSQFSWEVKPSNRAMIPTSAHLALRGGGGELIRTSAASRKAITDMEKESPNFYNLDFEDQIDELFKLFVSTESIPIEYLDKCRVLFSESFVFDRNYSLEQNIDWHYHYYRNRTHFGHYINSFSRNEIAFHPLMQKEFFYAANQCDLTARRNGKVCYDIIQKLDPNLNKITFDDGFWSNALVHKSPSVSELKERPAALKDYYNIQEKNSLLLKRPFIIDRIKKDSPGFFDKENMYILVINILLELVFQRKYTVKNIVSIINNLNRGKITALELFLKLIDYKNFMEVYNTYCNIQPIHKPFTQIALDFLSEVDMEKLLSSNKDYFHNFSYEIVQNKTLSFSVFLSDKFEALTENIEFAFYLYENKNIIKRMPYTNNRDFFYDSLEKEKNYFIKVFIRFSIDSETIETITLDTMPINS